MTADQTKEEPHRRIALLPRPTSFHLNQDPFFNVDLVHSVRLESLRIEVEKGEFFHVEPPRSNRRYPRSIFQRFLFQSLTCWTLGPLIASSIVHMSNLPVHGIIQNHERLPSDLIRILFRHKHLPVHPR